MNRLLPLEVKLFKSSSLLLSRQWLKDCYNNNCGKDFFFFTKNTMILCRYDSVTVNEVINYAHTFVKKEPLHTRGSNITVTVCTDVCIAGVCLFLYSVEEDIFMCSVVLLHVNVFEGKINCFSQRPLKINVIAV